MATQKQAQYLNWLEQTYPNGNTKDPSPEMEDISNRSGHTSFRATRDLDGSGRYLLVS